MKKYRYFKCSVETVDEYRSAGFILKDNRKNPEDKISKFFERNKNWIRYDGVYIPLTECRNFFDCEVNYLFKETIFGLFERVFF